MTTTPSPPAATAPGGALAGAAPPPAPGCCSSACSCPSSRSPRPSPPCAPCRSTSAWRRPTSAGSPHLHPGGGRRSALRRSLRRTLRQTPRVPPGRRRARRRLPGRGRERRLCAGPGRALSGVGGALVLPTSLALITTSFTDPRERGHRISVWVSVSGLGLAGPRAAHAGQAGPQAATASSPRISRPTGLLRTAVRFFPPPCGQGLLEHPWWNTAQGGYTDACLGVEVDLAVRVQHAGEVLLAADVR